MDQRQIEEFLSGNETEYLFNAETFHVISHDPDDEYEPFASIKPGGDLLFSNVLEDPDLALLSNYVLDGTDRPSTSEVMEDLSHGDWEPVTYQTVMQAWLRANRDEIKMFTGLTVEERRDDAQYLPLPCVGRDIASAADVDRMLRQGQSLYNAADGETLIPDISLDDDGREVFHGVMTAHVDARDAYVAASSAAEYARDTIPAPGSGATNRMGFVGVDDEEYGRLCDEVAAHKGWGVDTEARISKMCIVEIEDGLDIPEEDRRETLARAAGAAWVMPVIDPTVPEVLGTAVVETHASEDEESPWGYSWSTQAVVSDQVGNTTELDGTMYWGPQSAEASMLDSLTDLAVEYRPTFPHHARFDAEHRVSVPIEVFYQVRDEGVPCPTVSELVPSTTATLSALDKADARQDRGKGERTAKGLAH